MEAIVTMQLQRSVIVDYFRSIAGKILIGVGCSISASGPLFKDTFINSKEGTIFITNIAWIFNTVIIARNINDMKVYTAGFGFTFLTITLSIGVLHEPTTDQGS